MHWENITDLPVAQNKNALFKATCWILSAFIIYLKQESWRLIYSYNNILLPAFVAGFKVI